MNVYEENQFFLHNKYRAAYMANMYEIITFLHRYEKTLAEINTYNYAELLNRLLRAFHSDPSTLARIDVHFVFELKRWMYSYQDTKYILDHIETIRKEASKPDALRIETINYALAKSHKEIEVPDWGN